MFSFGRAEAPQFGGVGVMVDKPGMELAISPAERLEIAGPLAGRVEAFARRAAQRADWIAAEIPCRIEVVQAPRSHVGLGSGTQLGMAVAQGLNAFFAGDWRTPQEFAVAVGRGRRSAIGLYGAILGGLLIEGGKREAEEISPLISRIELPAAWRFVLAWPGGQQGLSGDAETTAFEQLPPVPLETTAALCQEALLELAPAAAAADFERFGESVFRFGCLAGKCFAAQQGGEFASARVAQLVSWFRQQGVRGVGQSSWGPAVFALTPDLEAGEALAAKLAASREHCGLEVMLASPANRGAAVLNSTAV
jgi:beta-RFAP synthase